MINLFGVFFALLMMVSSCFLAYTPVCRNFLVLCGKMPQGCGGCGSRWIMRIRTTASCQMPCNKAHAEYCWSLWQDNRIITYRHSAVARGKKLGVGHRIERQGHKPPGGSGDMLLQKFENLEVQKCYSTSSILKEPFVIYTYVGSEINFFLREPTGD